MSGPTPGPWTVAKTYAPYTVECDNPCENYYPGTTVTIPSVVNGDKLHHEAIEVWGENSEADASLIAAAPDLLAVCIRIASHFAGTVQDDVPLAIGYALSRQLDQAISKAEGK